MLVETKERNDKSEMPDFGHLINVPRSTLPAKNISFCFSSTSSSLLLWLSVLYFVSFSLAVSVSVYHITVHLPNRPTVNNKNPNLITSISHCDQFSDCTTTVKRSQRDKKARFYMNLLGNTFDEI